MTFPLRKIFDYGNKFWRDVTEACHVGIDVCLSHIILQKRDQITSFRPILKRFIIRLEFSPFEDFHEPFNFILISCSSTHNSVRLMPKRTVRVEQTRENRTQLRLRLAGRRKRQRSNNRRRRRRRRRSHRRRRRKRLRRRRSRGSRHSMGGSRH